MTIRKPFKYITKKYHFSRTGLYQRINKIPNFKKEHMKKKGNKWLIDLNGIKQITKPKHNSTSKFKHTRKGVKNSYTTKSELLNTNHNQKERINKLINDNYSQQQTIIKLTNINSSQQQAQQHSLNKLINQINNNLNQLNKSNKLLENQKAKLSTHTWLWRLFH